LMNEKDSKKMMDDGTDTHILGLSPMFVNIDGSLHGQFDMEWYCGGGPARFATPHLTIRTVNIFYQTFPTSIAMTNHMTGISAASHGKALVTRNENLSGQRNSCHVGGSTSAVTAEGIMEDMGYHDLGSIRRSGLRLYECVCQSGSIKALFRH